MGCDNEFWYLMRCFVVIPLVWERSTKAWKGWRAAVREAKEAKMSAREAKMAAVVEARLASAKKAEEGALYPSLAESGPAASAPSGDGE